MTSFQKLTVVAAMILTSQAFGYGTTLDTGRLLNEGNYRLGAETQFVTEGDDGINLAARFDGPINDELNWKTQLGFGTTDAFLGAFVKWIPYPDLDNQPAIGVIAGLQYARYSSLDELTLKASPLVSKTFKPEFGDWTPYASLPLGLRTVDGDTDLTVQLALGSEFRPNQWEKIHLLAEIGFDISESYSYFVVGASLEFDEDNGIEFK